MAETETLYGRNPVLEVLRAGRRTASELLLAQGLKGDARLDEIRRRAEQSGVRTRTLPRADLDRIQSHHQGVILQASVYPYSTIGEVFDAGSNADQPALILLLDSLQDPQNLGSLLRTAESAGVDGVLLPPRRAAGVSPAVVNASSGACEHLLIARANLAASISLLKEAGVWVAGLERAAGSVRLDVADFTPPLAIVVGHEGRGLSRLVRDRCDYLVEVPMRGRIESLNAAVAGSLALYHAWASRGYPGAR